MKNGHRGIPFPKSARVPIVGSAPPEGRHYYDVGAIVQHQDGAIEIETYECYFPVPMNGVHVRKLRDDVAEAKKRDGQPAPKVLLMPPSFIGFIPQAELDRQERERPRDVEVVQ